MENISNQKQKKKNIILESAVEMFLDKDYYQVTIEEIAEHAQVGKGTVYEYFSTKEELFRESIAYWMDLYTQNFDENLAYFESARESLYYTMTTHKDFLQEKGRWMRLLYAEKPYNLHELGHQVTERRQRLLDSLSSTIQRGIRNGEIKPEIDIEIAARAFLAYNYVVMGGLAVLEGIIPEKTDVDTLMDIFWEGVGIDGDKS